MRLVAENGGTRVSYDYSAEITGKVAAVGGRMLDSAARAIVNQFFERLVRQVERPEPVAPGAPSPSLWQRILQWLGIK